MKELDSHYIIDGREMDATPREILSAVCPATEEAPIGAEEDIVDESADPQPGGENFDPALAKAYAEAVDGTVRDSFPSCYSGSLSRLAVAKGLLEALFKDGHFKLGDLRPHANWVWNNAPVGSMAAFYESVAWACEYIDNLGVKLQGYSCKPGAGNSLELRCDSVATRPSEDTLFEESPFGTPDAHIETTRKNSPTALPSKGDWIIYIPFDTCRYRLGGSLLCQATGKEGGKSPDVTDADYFIDCYEVVRELVEDGIAVAGVPVTDGGLLTALHRFLGGKAFKADVASIMRSTEETDLIKLLFGEVPGVLIQIKDYDFDYLDAELLLQDVAYFPLGQISGADGSLELDTKGSTALKGILVSLMDNAQEGED